MENFFPLKGFVTPLVAIAEDGWSFAGQTIKYNNRSRRPTSGYLMAAVSTSNNISRETARPTQQRLPREELTVDDATSLSLFPLPPSIRLPVSFSNFGGGNSQNGESHGGLIESLVWVKGDKSL